jgi:hypothetical protein|tara:strand:- start:40 stop:330 length:291 start_codon:yes stop_codon:yes gene_type:complete
MPRHEKFISRHSMGSVVEFEVTEITDWAQMVGPWLVRCDEEAKTTGNGFWVLFDTSRGAGSSWKGVWGLDYNFKPDETLWIHDEFTRTYNTEKDYS